MQRMNKLSYGDCCSWRKDDVGGESHGRREQNSSAQFFSIWYEFGHLHRTLCQKAKRTVTPDWMLAMTYVRAEGGEAVNQR